VIFRPESVAIQAPGRLKAFAYLTAEKAALYRSIMRVFMESKERFALHLRSQQILDAIRICGLEDTPDQTEIEAALAQLCDWGNLQTRPDTSDVSTVEDFYKQRFVFQITNQGEAAERALELFQAGSCRKGELQTTALRDIRDLLQELKGLSREAEPDAGKIHRNLLTVHASFEDFASRAQAFMGSLQRNIDLQMGQTDQFASSTERLIDYVERFVSELVTAAEDIGRMICDIDDSGFEQLLQAVAERSTVDVVRTTPEDLESIAAEWRSHWGRFRDWFISRPGCPSGADILRGRARASLTTLLSVMMSINDRRISRIDRSNDFRVLARWFAEAASEADAHRLWRAVFGLCPARHLIVNDATLDDHEAHDVTAGTSWLDAPPLRISTRRRVSSYSRTARLSRIIDRTAEKEKLAAATHEETLRLLSAQSRFATRRRMRLSELEQFETGEFDLFLELLGEAVSAKVLADDTAEILSNDGCLRVKLEATGDGQTAVLHTPEGIFRGPDHWISVEPSSTEEVVT